MKNNKITAFFLLLFFGMSFNLFSQSDSIVVKSKILSYKYYYQGEKIKGKQVLVLIENHPIAYDQFKAASEAYTFANIFSVLGLAFLVTPIGLEIGGVDTDWSMAWAGAGLVLVSVPLYYKYKKHIPKSIDLYNQNPVPELEPLGQLKFGATNNGVGLLYSF